jgi:hypothetical protein
MTTSFAGYIYLLQDGKFIGTNVFKVGRTEQTSQEKALTRFAAYTPGTVVHYIRNVDVHSLHAIENTIIRLFSENYKLAKGKEWFTGDPAQMRSDIDNVINTYQNDPFASMVIENWNDPIPDSYTCQRCGFYTVHKNVLVAHLSRKKECEATHSDISSDTLLKGLRVRSKRTCVTDDGKYPCIRCCKQYKTAASKYHHQKNCTGVSKDFIVIQRSINTLEDNLNTRMDEIQNEIDSLREQINEYQTNK